MKEFLRDRAPDPGEAEQRLREARFRADAAPRTDPQMPRWLRRCGEICRSLGRWGESERLQRASLASAAELRDLAAARTTELALATTLQYAGRHREALELFDSLLERVRAAGDDELEDYVWQHRGKCLAEMDRWTAAIESFEQALALRKARIAREDDELNRQLVASSRAAVEAARPYLAS